MRRGQRRCRKRYRLTPKQTAAMKGALRCSTNIVPECDRDRERTTSTPTHQATPQMNQATWGDTANSKKHQAELAVCEVVVVMER